MRDDSIFLMFEDESSDESDDSNDAEDGTCGQIALMVIECV